MAQSKLFFIEGLPSVGKSTNSGILLSQLERNGYKARWIHEVARPHPTLFFYEAYLDENEYENFIKLHPHALSVIDKLSVRRNKGIALDLLELKWNYLDQIGDQAYQYLMKYDVWNFNVDRYM